MLKTKMVMTRNIELEEELKSTRDGYEEEIAVLLEQNEDLKMKPGVPVVKRKPEVDIRSEDYILIDDTDIDSDDDGNDDYEDEAGADIMESSTDQDY